MQAENPRAAQRVAERIHEATHVLKDCPEIGRIGELVDAREWVVKQTPYLLVYRLRNDVVEILRLWHGRQNWRGDSE